MQIRPAECQLTLEWTLPICVRKLEPITGYRNVHVDDLDATLTVHYWAVEDRAHEWEIGFANLDGVIISKQSDPVMWALIDRAITHDFQAINERVLERIADYAEAA